MAYSDHTIEQHADHASHGFWTKYVWSQDHKVIAIQYASVAIAVGLLGVALSDLMRCSLAFQDGFPLSTPAITTSS